MARHGWIKQVLLGIVFVLAGIIFGLTQAPYALALSAGSLPVSKGIYRLPYENGTEVRITSDHTTHPTALNRLDMEGINGSGNYTIVAAGDGWIRLIEDDNTVNCDSGCDNNYVWIEHPNGEWSKYSHFQTNSVDAAGISLDEFVSSGTPLGLEGDIGNAPGGQHLHFEVAVPNDRSNPINSAGFLNDDGDPSTVIDDSDGQTAIDYDRQNRIPVFCDIDFPVADRDEYTAANCQRDCAEVVSVSSGVNDNQVRHRQADNRVQTISGVMHIVESGGGEALRAGQQVILFPGFRAEPGSYFSASIDSCDRPGAT